MSHGHVTQSSTPGTGRDPSTKALVLEFLCLYTHDIKRKNQKRWQDARLKYHTFNKRIVVHDIRGNYVGDAHWSGSNDEFGDGEELMLDRGGVLVQVCEEVGKREQDLGELLDKRAKEVEARRVKAANTPKMIPRPTDNVHFQLIQRPLSGILQQASPGGGRIGRAAVPRESPYEVRLRDGQEQQQQETPPPSKKRKCDDSPPAKSGHARALFGTQLTLSARPMSTPFSRSQQYQPLHDRTNMAVPSSEQDKDRQKEGVEPAEKSKRSTSTSSKLKSKPAASSKPPPKLQAPNPIDSDEGDAEDSDVLMDDEPAQTPPRRAKEKSRPGSKQPQTNAKSQAPLTSEPAGGGRCKQPKKTSVDKPLSTSHSRKRRGSISSDKQSGDHAERNEVEEVSDGITKPAILVEPDVSTRRDDDPRSTKKRIVSKAKSRHRERSPIPPAADIVDLEQDAKQTAEPRTELRIRPRKKRGLLMLSEKVTLTEARREAPKPVEQQPPKEQTSNQSFDEWLLGSTESTEYQSGCDKQPAGKEDQLQTQTSSHSPVPIPPAIDNPVPIVEIDNLGSPPRPSNSHTGGKHLVRQTRRSTELAQSTADTKTRRKSNRNDSLDRDASDDDGSGVSGNSDAACAKSAKKEEQTIPQLHGLEAANNSPPLPTSGDDESPTDSRRKQRDQQSPSPIEKDKQNQIESTRSAFIAKDEAASKGPRIAKMARKSVKSKEIFGLQLPKSDYAIPAELATASTRLMPPSERTAQGGGETSMQTRPAGHGINEGGGSNYQTLEGTNIMQDKDKANGSTRKLTNPATKGKKAASKADAAGQTPQSLVPFDTVPHRRPEPTAPSKSVPIVRENTTLPGFSKANGGAWSKHAEDLLGMTRPKRRGTARA